MTGTNSYLLGCG